MSEFRRLVIENFQSHVLTEIDLIEGLNVFVGPSDSGKSSILRALRWVLFNHPRGTDFIREGAEQCRVSLTLTDGTELVRVRAKKKALNRYILRKPDREEEIYESLGVGPHPMILEAHGIHPLGKDTYVQVGSQLDPPFLLSESGGNKANLIGRISGAHWIDIAMKEATKERNQLKSQIRHLEQQEVSLEEKLQPYANVPHMEEQIQNAEQLYTQSMEKKQRVQVIKEHHKRWQQICAEKQQQQQVLEMLSSLSEIEKKQLHCEQILIQIKSWKQLAVRKQHLQEQQKRYQEQLTATAHLDEVGNQTNEAKNKWEHLMRLRTLASRYTQFVVQRNDCQKRLVALESISSVEKDVERLSAKIQSIAKISGLLARQMKITESQKVIAAHLQATTKVKDDLEKISSWKKTMERISKLRSTFAQYELNQENLQKGKQFMKQNTVEIQRETELYIQLFEQLGRCPTCGAAVHETSLEHILG